MSVTRARGRGGGVFVPPPRVRIEKHSPRDEMVLEVEVVIKEGGAVEE